MTACESGHLDLIDVLIDTSCKTIEQKIKMLEYVGDCGGPFHAAITGQQPKSVVQALIEKIELT